MDRDEDDRAARTDEREPAGEHETLGALAVHRDDRRLGAGLLGVLVEGDRRDVRVLVEYTEVLVEKDLPVRRVGPELAVARPALSAKPVVAVVRGVGHEALPASGGTDVVRLEGGAHARPVFPNRLQEMHRGAGLGAQDGELADLGADVEEDRARPALRAERGENARLPGREVVSGLPVRQNADAVAGREDNLDGVGHHRPHATGASSGFLARSHAFRLSPTCSLRSIVQRRGV